MKTLLRRIRRCLVVALRHRRRAGAAGRDRDDQHSRRRSPRGRGEGRGRAATGPVFTPPCAVTPSGSPRRQRLARAVPGGGAGRPAAGRPRRRAGPRRRSGARDVARRAGQGVRQPLLRRHDRILGLGDHDVGRDHPARRDLRLLDRRRGHRRIDEARTRPEDHQVRHRQPRPSRSCRAARSTCRTPTAQS